MSGRVSPRAALASVAGAEHPITVAVIHFNRPITVTAIDSVVLAANVAISLHLIPRCGNVGAASASTITYALLARENGCLLVGSPGIRWAGVLPRAGDLLQLRAGAAKIWPRERAS